MKKTILLSLLFISTITWSQTVPKNSRLAITQNVKQNTATRVVVQDSITKELNWILKSSLASPIYPLQSVLDAGNSSTKGIIIETPDITALTVVCNGGNYNSAGIQVYGADYGISASGNTVAISASGEDTAISAYGNSVGISGVGGVYGIFAVGYDVGISASGAIAVLANGESGIESTGNSGSAGIFNIPTTNNSNIVEFKKNTVNQSFITHDGKVVGTRLSTSGYTVATLPSGTIGDITYVTDALSPVYLGMLVGGGSVVCPAFYNGTTWVAH